MANLYGKIARETWMQTCARPLPFSAVLALAVFPASLASAQTWTSEYLPADEAGEVSVCSAGVEYSNALFLIRVFDENIDFLFARDDFTLPWGAELGTAIFEIDGSPFELFALTFAADEGEQRRTTEVMQFLPRNEDVEDLLNLLSWGTRLDILFPNGSSYPVTLSGSGNAISAMATCYDRNHTGPLQNNPFDPGGKTPGGGVNPFQ